MSPKKNGKSLEREKSPEVEKPPSITKKLSKITTTDNLPKVKLSTIKLPRIPKLQKVESSETFPTPPPVKLQTTKKKTPSIKVDVVALITPGTPASSIAPSSTGSSRARSGATGTVTGSSVSSTPQKLPNQKQIDDEK